MIHCHGGPPACLEVIVVRVALTAFPLPDHVLFRVSQPLLKHIKHDFHMLKVDVLLNNTNLFFMHEGIHISALFNESRSQVLRLLRPQMAQNVEYHQNEVISFSNLAFLAFHAHNGSHELVHYPLNCDDLQNRA